MRRRDFAIAAVCLPLALGLLACEQRSSGVQDEDVPARSPRPNIVFIMIDTLRADRLGAYGHDGGLSPTIDALAAQGTTFERAISACPWTLPSIASLFSGYYPTAHKAVTTDTRIAKMNVGREPKVQVFGGEFETLAEKLKQAGYQTAGFVANPFIRREYGFAQGFDHYDTSFAHNETPGSKVTAAAVAWLARRDPSKPFFIYLHYMDVHGPYNARPAIVDPLLAEVAAKTDKRLLMKAERKRRRNFFSLRRLSYIGPPQYRGLDRYADYWQARYAGAVAETDRHLRKLRKRLMEMGLWEQAYVIVTADHGEALGEHREWGHGWTAEHNQLHVPLILRWPGQVPAGKRVTNLVRLIDLMPTLIAQLGLPPVKHVQGASLVGHITGNTPPEPRTAFAEGVKQGAEEKAFYLGGWKVRMLTEPLRYKLFHVAEDPAEMNDLAGQQPKRLAELKRLLERQMEQNAALAEGRGRADIVEVDPATLRRLQALGYFGSEDDDEQAHEDEKQPTP